MKSISLFRLLFASSLGISISLILASAVMIFDRMEAAARQRDLSNQTFQDFKLNSTTARFDAGTFNALSKPDPSQASIQRALEVFNIKLPAKIIGPSFNPSLEDRGVTIRHGVFGAPIVFIGREAFSSWALLGSTIAHEVEVHCRQNFLAIHLENLAGLGGTMRAEREAYLYELANSSRFALSYSDQELIRGTMSYYYPDVPTKLLTKIEMFNPLRFQPFTSKRL